MRSGLTRLIAIGGILALATVSAAQDKKPDATLKLTEGSVGLGIGYSWGSGTLFYKGKKYPFKVSGVSVVAVGMTRAEATGEVFNLKKVKDFEGTYTSATAEGTLGGGGGATSMRNQNGVAIHLLSTTQGLGLKLAPEGVKLTLK